MAPSFASLVRARWLRRTVYALAALFVVLVLAIWLGVPPALRWALETVGTRELGRTVHVGAVHANPFTLAARLNDLVVDGAPGETAPLLAIGELSADVSTASIWFRAPVFDRVALKGVAVNIVRLEPQRFNFSDIVERLLARPSTGGEPARFAVHNIELDGGAVKFDDRVRQQTNALTDIRIAIPFISSLPTDVKVQVEPAFFARLDGTPIELKGETLPFERSLETAVRLKLDGLDVPRYLSFSPVRLNFQVQRGALDTDLRIAFRRAVAAAADQPARAAQLLISGPVALRDFALVAPADSAQQRVGGRRLAVAIDEYAVFDDRLRLGEVTLEGPDLTVARDARGQIGGLEPLAAPAVPATEAKPAAAAPPARPFDLALGTLRISDGRLGFTDASVGRFAKQFEAIAFEGRDIATVGDKPAALKLSARSTDGESFDATGEARIAQRAARLTLAVKDIDVRTLAPYVAGFARARVEGRVDASTTLELDATPTPPVIRAGDLAMAARTLRVEGPPELGAKIELAALALEGGSVDVGDQRVEIGKIALDAPRALVTRLADGSIGWASVVRATEPASNTAPARPGATAPSAPWRVTVAAIELARGDVQFVDRAVDPPVTLRAVPLAATVKNVSADGSTPVRFSVRARIGKAGGLVADGQARWDRLGVTARLDARDLDVAALRAYFAAQLNAEFASAELSTRGTLTVAQAAADATPTVKYAGDARIANVHLLNPGGEGDLLKWSSLVLDRLDLAVGPEAPRVEVGAVALADFYARVVLSSEGRLNLQDIVKGAPPEAPAAPSTAPAPPPAAPENAPRPLIRLGGITLGGGQVNFTDNFVKPNYVANLTQLGGKVGALASDDATAAELDITAKVDDDAPVEIRGKLNPLAPALFLDIAGSAKGVDLPRFTPYSAKYAGYPITKGKLSVEVTYKVQDGKLAANNRVFLDQLTFGERVESPDATKLPVLLAVALLKNRRGEIDINLPISGSLDDPKFSVGGVILRVLINLITKAVTAPFALIAAAFGTSEELSYVEFAPGSAEVTEAQAQKIGSLAKALADRPGLRLDVIGRADPARDIEGLRRARYEAKLRAVKLRQLVRTGGASVEAGAVTIDAAERPALLERLYSEEKLPDKPRNVFGVAKSIPPAEMEQRILAAITVGPQDLRALADERAAAVRRRLETEGGVEHDRLFLVEPRLTAEGIKDSGATTRVDFVLK